MELKCKKGVDPVTFRDPLLARISEAAAKLTGIGFAIVYPQESGWGQIVPSSQTMLPGFCKLVQQTGEGGKHCRMCHILMSIAACNDGLTERRCHAGVSCMVAPICDGGDSMAVISSCVFTPGLKQRAWKDVKARGKALGLDLESLKKSYDELPEMDERKLEVARELIAIAGLATKEVVARAALEKKLAELRVPARPTSKVVDMVEQQLREALVPDAAPVVAAPGGDKRKNGKIPRVVALVADLVSRKSGMAFSVSDIAAAARMTPNYFSCLFRQHMGQNFSEFLVQKRIETAKTLLRDLTLNIGEVSRRSGFEDPGYFSRRFRQKTGLSPGEWRNQCRCRPTMAESVETTRCAAKQRVRA